MLNATWLETFMTLCEEGHFTRAAERLNMTQPGVSQHLSKLERQVGQPLVSRDGKAFVLTPAGEVVLALARQRRAEEDELRQALLKDDPDAGETVLACSGSLALLLYPRFIEWMTERPRLRIDLEAAPQAKIVEGVLEGVFDLGIVVGQPKHPRLDGLWIGRDELCLLLPASADPRPDFAALQALGFIAHPDGYAYADELLGANFADAYRGATLLQARSYVNQVGQIPEPVARGIGYTILPRSGIGGYVKRDCLQVITLSKPIFHDLWLIQRKARILPARTRQLRSLIQHAIAAGMNPLP